MKQARRSQRCVCSLAGQSRDLREVWVAAVGGQGPCRCLGGGFLAEGSGKPRFSRGSGLQGWRSVFRQALGRRRQRGQACALKELNGTL